ncbi:MAG: NusG domain II-containing protein [Bacillota bacterium]
MQSLKNLLTRMTTADIVLVIFLLIFSLVGILLPIVFQPEYGEYDLVVEQGGEELFRQEFPREDGIEEFKFRWQGEEYQARLEYDNNRVRLHRLSKEIVPLDIHEQMGWIQRPGQMIVAVPVKMVIRIEGESSDREYDGVVGSYEN